MAVYTHITTQETENFLTTYDIGKLITLKPITEGVENSNYHLQTTEGQYILTIYEKRTNRQDLPFFLDLMKHLSTYINCPTPITNREGNSFSNIQGKEAAIINFLSGASVSYPDCDHCYLLGTEIAKLHLAGKNFRQTRSDSIALPQWQELWKQIEDKVPSTHKNNGIKILHNLTEFWSQKIPKNIPTGIIHGDIFPDNVFFQNNRVSGIIDFYFACNQLYIYDIAIAINAWCFEEDGRFNNDKCTHLLQAYHTIRPLKNEEKDIFPIISLSAAFRFYLTRSYDIYYPVAGNVILKDPQEYWQKIKFHQKMSKLEDYGVEI